MTHRTGFLIFSLFLAFSADAKPKKGPHPAPSPSPESKVVAKPAAIPPVLLEIERKYVKAGTLEAKFEQTNTVTATQGLNESSGVIMVKHPNKFRWETLKPEKNLLVSDGFRFWFYTPPFEKDEPGQVVIKKSSEVQSELANKLLSGAFSQVKGLTVSQESEKAFRLNLDPASAAFLKSARIEIDPVKKVIQWIKLEHQGGNTTVIRLTDIKLGESMDEQFFHFTPPPNTEQIRE